MKKSGYDFDFKYEPATQNGNRKKNRGRKITWFNPPYSVKYWGQLFKNDNNNNNNNSVYLSSDMVYYEQRSTSKLAMSQASIPRYTNNSLSQYEIFINGPQGFKSLFSRVVHVQGFS